MPPARKPLKKGGAPPLFTARERDLVAKGLAAGQSPETIAAAVERPLESVIAFMMRGEASPPPKEEEPDDSPPVLLDELSGAEPSTLKLLHKSSTWKLLKEQFDSAELRYYEDQYCSFIDQFGEDVTPSERVQIHKAVQYEILMNRNKVEQRKLLDGIENDEEELRRLKKIHYDPNDPEKTPSQKVTMRMVTLANDISDRKNEMKGCLKTHTDLDGKHQSLLGDLKATRNQRLEKSDKRYSFSDLIKSVMGDKAMAASGREAKLMNIAAKKSRAELGTAHKYMDGQFDSPLMNCDNVGELYDQTPSEVADGEEAKG